MALVVPTFRSAVTAVVPTFRSALESALKGECRRTGRGYITRVVVGIPGNSAP